MSNYIYTASSKPGRDEKWDTTPCCLTLPKRHCSLRWKSNKRYNANIITFWNVMNIAQTKNRIDQAALFETTIKSLPLLHRGKVRDIYGVDEDRLLIVQTDRLSAFDVILPTPVPGKGRLLTALSGFWFEKLAHIIPNHLTGISPESVVVEDEREQVSGRAFVVKRLKPLPMEAIVRGYIAGSGWKDYKKTGMICGVGLAAGLQEASRIPGGAIFTPSTKAAQGAHDENIPFSEAEKLLGK